MEHGTGPAWLEAIESSFVAQAMRDSIYLYPFVETVHIFGFALLFGAIAVVDFGLLGWRPLARHAQPVAVVGLAVAVPTGMLLFASEASAFVANPFFLVKLGVIALATLNALMFQFWPTKAAAVISLLGWATAIACGRLIAYI